MPFDYFIILDLCSIDRFWTNRTLQTYGWPRHQLLSLVWRSFFIGTERGKPLCSDQSFGGFCWRKLRLRHGYNGSSPGTWRIWKGTGRFILFPEFLEINCILNFNGVIYYFLIGDRQLYGRRSSLCQFLAFCVKVRLIPDQLLSIIGNNCHFTPLFRKIIYPCLGILCTLVLGYYLPLFRKLYTLVQEYSIPLFRNNIYPFLGILYTPVQE